MPRLSLVAAMARNRVIGRANQLPWHLPEDLKRFRRLTLGAPVIMGRKTHHAIGRPLPHRHNIVVTRNLEAAYEGCSVAHSLDAALAIARAAPECFVIGGGDLYRLALPHADRLYLTLIDADYDGDTYFPPIDMATWRECERVAGDGMGAVRYDFAVYERRA